MGATAAPPTFASYRNAVEDLMDSGEPFDWVEDVIDASDLRPDTKDALWLFAFFQRDSRGADPRL